MMRGSQFTPFRYGTRRPGVPATQAEMLNREKECLAIIAGRIQETGVPPSYEELRQALRLTSKNGVFLLIRRLQSKGRIRCLPGRARAIEICAQEVLLWFELRHCPLLVPQHH